MVNSTGAVHDSSQSVSSAMTNSKIGLDNNPVYRYENITTVTMERENFVKGLGSFLRLC